MSRVIRRRWTGDQSAPTRRGRLSCEYEAYVPDSLAGRHFTLDGDVAADMADAEAAITRMNAEASALADTEALARLLLRAESLASARIEGLEVSRCGPSTSTYFQRFAPRYRRSRFVIVRLRLNIHRIAGRMHSPDYIRRTVDIHRLTETADMDVDGLWLNVGSTTPNRVQEVFARKDSSRMLQKES